MGILIPRQLTEEQYIKLFSNPVSGIACDFGAVTNMDNINYLQNIRYSKSMMLGALNFWFDRLHTYYLKVYKIRKNSLIDVSDHIAQYMIQLRNIMNMVEDLPNSFLFSHRYIKEVDINHYRKWGGKGLADTNTLLNKKYKDIIVNNGFRPQVGTLDPHMPVMSSTGISFTIFANEHPYIQRQKISKVGMTDKGNIYVLHRKKKK